MKCQHILGVPFVICVLFLFTQTVQSQDSARTANQNKSRNHRLMLSLSDQDIFLPISSLEWGIPDRWSFTSRYIHMFNKDRNDKTWLNNLCITLSPGTAGGRLAIGYQGIFSPKSMPDFAVFGEARLVLLRTWAKPLSTATHCTFIGAEIRSSLSALVNLGVGYFTQISNSAGRRKSFYGLHIGLGI